MSERESGLPGRGMNLRELECFLAVVDHGGITRAASALYLAQPSLSQIIRRLEADLGIDLFRRVGRGLVLSPAGEAFVGPARQVLRDMANARSVAAGYRGLEGGRVDLAISASLTSSFLAAWVGDFRRKHPKIALRLTQHDGDTDEIATLIRSGAAELAYTVGPISRQGIECRHIGQGEILLALPLGWGDDLPDPVPVEMLAGLPFVVDRGFGQRYLATIRDTHGIEPDIVVDISESGDLLPLLAAGAGAALLPMRQAMEARRRGATLRMLDPAPARDIYAITPTSPLTPQTQAFLDLSIGNLEHWHRAVGERTARGMPLLDAAVDADNVIESAYQRLHGNWHSGRESE
ncbi:DNA-binding transcriptional LysR family regulator [Nocardioides albertanoniae]|uniref:DNA-binding transcriptional LysR family regulator n=1 Tax=Nocardioides albertanoniae TaxID=1175486 RepID=A0A543A916_9ACTN|nr:LysR family transcriptional regulator [Nocardioides albertanoniae]TQL69097.1 DNA-binding transcriptional LysR family regulator [Nocardioides albertanoniae]